MSKPFLSVVTPAYNRAHLLGKCFDSLLRQTDQDFEWIVVDDGSTDQTEDTVKEFRAEFPIIYVKKENGGKHTALNESHAHIHGSYILILDSDDYLTDTAVEQVRAGWEKYADDAQIGIVTFLKGGAEHDPNCTAADEGVPVDIMRYRRTVIYSQDCCEVIRTELFQKYPFPVFAGEKFVSEGALWNRVSFTHKCVYINSVIYICEYLEGGLTQSGRKMRIRNPRGGMYTANLNMNRKNFFRKRIKNGLLYTCYGCFAGMSPVKMAGGCDSKLLMWLCLPFGWMMYLLWKRQNR